MLALWPVCLGTFICLQFVVVCPYDTDEAPRLAERRRQQQREWGHLLSTTPRSTTTHYGTGSLSHTVYMDKHCRFVIHDYIVDDARVYVEHSVHVELMAHPAAGVNLECVVTFSTRDPDWRLLLHFEKVDINYHPGTVDRFRIFDGANEGRELSPARGLYGTYSKGSYEFSSGNIRDYTSSKQALTLKFVGSPSETFAGFRLLLTVFKDPSPLTGRCEEGYIHCRVNGYCINDRLLCDGTPNCGQRDLTDEKNCHHSFNPHTDDNDNHSLFQGPADLGLMAGCALSIVILVVVIIWTGVIFLKKKKFGRNRRRYARHESSSSDAATTPPPNPCIVEPAQIHRVMSPPVGFLEPPPVYSENDVMHAPPPSGVFEMPPPYTPVDETDTAGLLLNESSVYRNNNSSSIANNQQPPGTHSFRPVRSVPVHQEAPELRPLTGVGRQTEQRLSESPTAAAAGEPLNNSATDVTYSSAPPVQTSAATQTEQNAEEAPAEDEKSQDGSTPVQNVNL